MLSTVSIVGFNLSILATLILLVYVLPFESVTLIVYIPFFSTVIGVFSLLAFLSFVSDTTVSPAFTTTLTTLLVVFSEEFKVIL